MSRRLLMLAAIAAALVMGVTTGYAARQQPAPPDAALQPPEPPEPPRPPREPREMRDREAPRAVMMGGGMQMTAIGKFLYILRGDEILQFDATSLEFVKKIRVPAPERPNRDGDRRDGERREGQPPRNAERAKERPPERDDP